MKKKMLIPVLCLSLIMTGVTGVYAEEAVSEEVVSEEAGAEETNTDNSAEETADAAVAEETADAEAELPEGVVPVTWDVSEEHLMIEGDEAREFYERIVARDYPSMEELKANHVVQQLDALSVVPCQVVRFAVRHRPDHNHKAVFAVVQRAPQLAPGRAAAEYLVTGGSKKPGKLCSARFRLTDDDNPRHWLRLLSSGTFLFFSG